MNDYREPDNISDNSTASASATASSSQSSDTSTPVRMDGQLPQNGVDPAVLQQHIAELANRIEQQRQQINALQPTLFELSPNQIIQQFNNICPFTGENYQNLPLFLRNVEAALELCGQDNRNLKDYCLRQVIQTKIGGQARSFILEIPENLRTWATVVQTLRERFRPRTTIMQQMLQAREVKVFNLKDLLHKISSIKAKCNEILDFDNTNYSFESIDSELVQIVKYKLIPIVSLQIDSNSSLSEIIHKFSTEEVFQTNEAIKECYRLKSSNDATTKTNTRNQISRPNSYNNNNRYNFNSNQNYNNGQNRTYNSNPNYNNGPSRTYNSNPNYNNGPNRTYNPNANYNNQQNSSFNHNTNHTNNNNNHFNPFNASNNRFAYNNQNRPNNNYNYLNNNRSVPMEVDSVTQMQPFIQYYPQIIPQMIPHTLSSDQQMNQTNNAQITISPRSDNNANAQNTSQNQEVNFLNFPQTHQNP